MRRPNAVILMFAMLALGLPVRPSSFEPGPPADVTVRWPTKTIEIAISSSFTSAINIVEGSDTGKALNNALDSWARVAGIKFVVTTSNVQSVSAVNRPDGVNLITIAATADNVALFDEQHDAARTRVFYDSATGVITEADIVLNPFPYSADGVPLQFSTDGTPGTYDLESTIAHEIGHLLGLGHSNVLGATMQPGQGVNGTYGQSAWSERTISDVDVVAVRNLYGPCEEQGTVKGRILNNLQGNLVASAGVHIWLEEIGTGRLIADAVTNSKGTFSIGCVPAGEYRAIAEYIDSSHEKRQRGFRSTEISSAVRINARKSVDLNYVFVPPHNSTRTLVPRFLGLDGDLSTISISATAGMKLKIYIAGRGIDQVPASGFVVNSPYISVDASSLTLEDINPSLPVVSFDLTIAANAPAGEYTIRLQSNSGEMAYLPGAITLDPR